MLLGHYSDVVYIYHKSGMVFRNGYAPYGLVRHKASWNSTADSFLDSKYINSFKSAILWEKVCIWYFYGEISRTLCI